MIPCGQYFQQNEYVSPQHPTHYFPGYGQYQPTQQWAYVQVLPQVYAAPAVGYYPLQQGLSTQVHLGQHLTSAHQVNYQPTCQFANNGHVLSQAHSAPTIGYCSTNDAAAHEKPDGSAAAYSRPTSSAAAKPSPAKGKPTNAKLQRVSSIWTPEVCCPSVSSLFRSLLNPFLFFFFPFLSSFLSRQMAKEDECLKRIMANTKQSNRIPWSALAMRIPGKTAVQLRRR